jgi:uncharacterized protein YdcH (DUF465 family)
MTMILHAVLSFAFNAIGIVLEHVPWQIGAGIVLSTGLIIQSVKIKHIETHCKDKTADCATRFEDIIDRHDKLDDTVRDLQNITSELKGVISWLKKNGNGKNVTN